MQTAIPAAEATQERARIERDFVSLVAVLFLLFLCLPMFASDRSPLGSDESLYLSEALNIAEGKGLTYATGDAIVHRPPLYPAMQSVALKISGNSFDAAYVLPRVAIVVNVVLLFLLTRQLFGTWAALVSGALAAASPFLRGFGTTLYLDGVETSFILASLLVYWHALHKNDMRLHAAAGALLGLAFLTKESAVLLVPLPLVIALTTQRDSGWKRALIAWFAGFAALTAWWWAWVLAQSGRLFLVGPLGAGLTLFVVFAGVAAVIAGLVYLRRAPTGASASVASRVSAVMLLLGWGVFFLYGLESKGYLYERDYINHVPSYFANVFTPNVQPALLIGVAWVWAFVKFVRGSRECGLLAVSLLLFAPYTLVVADRDLALRDILPVIYLSFIAAGGLAAWLVEWGASLDEVQGMRILRGAGVLIGAVVVGAVVLHTGAAVSQPTAYTYQDDWQNVLSQRISNWLEENVPFGTHVMSSRLYYSQTYFQTGAKYPTYQLPTVEAQLKDGKLERRSTLFRWEDDRLPGVKTSDAWVYLTRYPVKGYLVGLAEEDLIAELKAREAGYVVLSTADAGFSSPSMRAYFDQNPAFSQVALLTASATDEAVIYKVDLTKLAPAKTKLAVTRPAYEYFENRLGGPGPADLFFGGLNPAGFLVTDR